MPSYAWVCFGCGKANAAGLEKCAFCGFGARASGREILGARQSHEPEQVERVTPKSAPEAPPNEAHAFLFIGFGTLCLVGAYVSFSTGHWPVFMPPLLDLFGVPLSGISERLGAYVGGFVAGVVGLFCVGGGFAILRKRKTA